MKHIAVLILVGSCVLGACSDSDGKNAREEIEDVAGEATASAAGQAMRAALEAEDLESGQTLRDVDVLKENAADVPGDPTVVGIVDADGDGNDDDGKVELKVGDQAVCVIVNDQNDVSVDNDPCTAAGS